jgi:D-sedoheptulose 7-phosphate isomerase
MARFPERKYADISEFADAYAECLLKAHRSIGKEQLRDAGRLLAQAYAAGRWVFACGNGGSAAIANHLMCDHCKGVQTDTSLHPRVMSLSANLELLTAIANDISYDDVFVYQLRSLASPGDVLITISASGDSENVVRAQKWAKANGVKSIAMTGFAGGRTRANADVSLHVEGENYGVVEDVHQSLMHVLAQYLRLENMPWQLVSDRKF